MNKCYKHILVPLDGSELAERALPHAMIMAQLCQAEVTFLQVVPPIKEVIAADSDHPMYVDEQWHDIEAHDQEYLHTVCERHGCADLTVHTVVEMGTTAAEKIIEYAHENPVDLIVMATHGRSGLKRWVYGSVADKVLRGANLPTLLVRCHSEEEAV